MNLDDSYHKSCASYLRNLSSMNSNRIKSPVNKVDLSDLTCPHAELLDVHGFTSRPINTNCALI